MSSIKFSAILCDFWAVTPEQLAILFKQLWGRDVSEEEVLKIGERVWNLGRLFNLREGVEKDDLPKKLYAKAGAFAEGPSAGQAVGEDHVRGHDRRVLQAARLGRHRRPQRGQARRARRRRAPLTADLRETKGNECLT